MTATLHGIAHNRAKAARVGAFATWKDFGLLTSDFENYPYPPARANTER